MISAATDDYRPPTATDSIVALHTGLLSASEEEVSRGWGLPWVWRVWQWDAAEYPLAPTHPHPYPPSYMGSQLIICFPPPSDCPVYTSLLHHFATNRCESQESVVGQELLEADGVEVHRCVYIEASRMALGYKISHTSFQ